MSEFFSRAPFFPRMRFSFRAINPKNFDIVVPTCSVDPSYSPATALRGRGRCRGSAGFVVRFWLFVFDLCPPDVSLKTAHLVSMNQSIRPFPPSIVRFFAKHSVRSVDGRGRRGLARSPNDAPTSSARARTGPSHAFNIERRATSLARHSIIFRLLAFNRRRSYTFISAQSS